MRFAALSLSQWKFFGYLRADPPLALAIADRHAPLGELGTFALSLPNKRLLFASSPSSALPNYPTTVPPSSIRDNLAPSSSSPSGSGPASRSSTPTALRGFGSDSLRSGGGGSGRASPVVLVPTNFAGTEGGEGRSMSMSASPAGGGGGGRRGFVDLEDFYGDEESESESEEGSGSGSEDEEEGSGSEESGSEGEEKSSEESEEEEEDEREELALR